MNNARARLIQSFICIKWHLVQDKQRIKQALIEEGIKGKPPYLM
jgi:hypothetical protein